MPTSNLPHSRRAMDIPVPVPRDALRAASAEAAAAADRVLSASDDADRQLALLDRARAAVAAYAFGEAELLADLAEAEGEHALLVTTAVAALREAKQAEARKVAAIADVMRATAIGMLPQLRDAEVLAGRLRASIAGYLNCWASNGAEVFKPVPVEVSLLIKEPQAAPLMALAALNWQQAAACWEEYRMELAHDPDAKPPVATNSST